jgi:hypothetical protein
MMILTSLPPKYSDLNPVDFYFLLSGLCQDDTYSKQPTSLEELKDTINYTVHSADLDTLARTGLPCGGMVSNRKHTN